MQIYALAAMKLAIEISDCCHAWTWHKELILVEWEGLGYRHPWDDFH